MANFCYLQYSTKIKTLSANGNLLSTNQHFINFKVNWFQSWQMLSI